MRVVGLCGLSLLATDWMWSNDLHMVGGTLSGWLGNELVLPPPDLHSQHIRMWYLVIALCLIVVLKPFSRIHTRYSTSSVRKAEKAHLYKTLQNNGIPEIKQPTCQPKTQTQLASNRRTHHLPPGHCFLHSRHPKGLNPKATLSNPVHVKDPAPTLQRPRVRIAVHPSLEKQVIF